MKNCVIYLVKNDEAYIRDLNESLCSLSKYVEPALEGDVDLIIFVEAGFPRDAVSYSGQLTLIFREVDFSYLPNNLRRNQVPEYFPNPVDNQHTGFGIGYRHMCRFYSGALYQDGHLESYDYYLRLDTDSRFLSVMDYDPFERLRKRGGVYGYIRQATQFDHPAVCFGLHDETLRWVRDSGTWLEKFRARFVAKNRMYYTNFEVGSVKFFSSRIWLDYFNALEKSNGIFLARWGDAPIKYLGLHILVKRSKRVPLTGFRYGHGAVYENDKSIAKEYQRRALSAVKRAVGS